MAQQGGQYEHFMKATRVERFCYLGPSVAIKLAKVRPNSWSHGDGKVVASLGLGELHAITKPCWLVATSVDEQPQLHKISLTGVGDGDGLTSGLGEGLTSGLGEGLGGQKSLHVQVKTSNCEN
jgi:hypothetical protein